jgi:branched-subunit amino acid aminotransferase/4-amino-4-deoxychorismate lyase
MIWHDGEVIPDDALRVGIDDRVFEHGLGLFETFRSWDGRAPLLPRHLARLRASAEVLGIPLEAVRLPDRTSITRLLDAAGLGGDALLRLTVTGGSASGRPPVAWMTARPLPPPERVPLSVWVDRNSIGKTEGFIHRHKMLNYWGRRLAYEKATSLGADELLLTSREGWLYEGSRNNVLVVTTGRSRVIETPALLQAPILPGIMRGAALEFARAHGYEVEERIVDSRELYDAEAIFLTNSVRGVRPVGRIDDRQVGSGSSAELVRLLTEELPRYLRAMPDIDEPAP